MVQSSGVTTFTGLEVQENPLQIDIAGVCFNNPVLTASGTCGYGLDMAELIDLNRLGGICTKGLSARPMRVTCPCA
jgi:dihydroorotate dehydrogenase